MIFGARVIHHSGKLYSSVVSSLTYSSAPPTALLTPMVEELLA